MEILYVGSLVGVVIVAILFKLHFTQKMGSLCHGTPFFGECGALFIYLVEV
jgi:hypothetical protein